jgi:DNA-binding CsgD family transcriptional regulator
MTTVAMASADDEHGMESMPMPRSERARARDADEPWLGHGPRIPDANLCEILAVAGRVRELLGPDVNIPDPATTDLRSAEAALTAASERLAEVLRRRRDAATHRGSGDRLELLLELARVRDRLREARSRQRIAALSRVQESLGRLGGISSTSALIGRAPEEVCRLGFDRAIISRVHGSLWVPEAVHIVGDPEWAQEILQAGRVEPQQLTHMILETEMVRRRGPLLVANVQSDPRVHQPIAAASLSRSYVAAPIMPQGRVIGFLHADCYVQRRHMDEFDRDLLWMFAQAFGYAFERAVLLERLHSLRGEVGRLTMNITRVADELVSAEVEIARLDRENLAAARDAAAIFVVDEHITSPLTRREIDVLKHMASGKTNASIAARLVVSEGTVKSHVKHILRKLAAANRAEAVSVYLRMERDTPRGRFGLSTAALPVPDRSSTRARGQRHVGHPAGIRADHRLPRLDLIQVAARLGRAPPSAPAEQSAYDRGHFGCRPGARVG